MKNSSRIVVSLLSLWLVIWIVLSWPAIQDDALIHLRYADLLYRVHFITFDGVHASYGTSSLLYVSLLAFLRAFTASPLLPRITSTAAHLGLFAGFAIYYLRSVQRTSTRVQTLALSLLILLALPSAVRWLDDGMETGLVIALVSIVAYQAHRRCLQPQNPSTASFLIALILGFLLVILRNELGVVALFVTCGIAFTAIINATPRSGSQLLRITLTSSPFLCGAILAAIMIRLVMHSLLPDTALAKSHGIAAFFGILTSAENVMASSLLFGIASLLLWLLSVAMLLSDRRARVPARLLPTLLANALFPCVLLAAALRGQEIQGVRYLIWTFFFSIFWNLLELRHLDAEEPTAAAHPLQLRACMGLFAVCLLILPVESYYMHRVLATRAHTMNLFMSEDLAGVLQGKHGIAVDVGYISYFTNTAVCDIAGLVNGRQAASLTYQKRIEDCTAQRPDFIFGNSSQITDITAKIDISSWQLCGQYDLGNLTALDRHFLIVRPELAASACNATHSTAVPANTFFQIKNTYN